LLYLFIFFRFFFNRVFGRFVTRGVIKHDETFSQKNRSGLIIKNAAFVSSFFLPLVSSIVLNHAFGRSITRGVQKRDLKIRKLFQQPPKKVLTDLTPDTSLFIFSPPP
jgi:hypothetical protein